MKWRAYVANDAEELFRIGLGDGATCVHLVYDEGDGASTEFLDEEVAEEIVVAGEVAHVHNLGGTPCEVGGRARARLWLRHGAQRVGGGGGGGRCKETGDDEGRLVAGEEVVKDADKTRPAARLVAIACGRLSVWPSWCQALTSPHRFLSFRRPLRHCPIAQTPLFVVVASLVPTAGMHCIQYGHTGKSSSRGSA